MSRRLRLALRFLAWWVFVALAAAVPVRAGDETCYPIPADPWAPAGVAGCTLDGPTTGTASTWGGSVAAANWCTHAVRDTRGCGLWAVQSLRTGLVIRVAPAEFCHCYWQTDRRLIDLSRGQVQALGLDPAAGLFRVKVWPVDSRSGAPYLPDTAVAE